MNATSNRWTDIINVFPPYWTISAIPTESGPADVSAMQAYVEHEDIQPLDEVLRRMRPELDEHAKVVIVGQKGTGKSMDLTWIAGRLSRTHFVIWLDALGLDTSTLLEPLNLFAAIGVTAIKGAESLDVHIDAEYLQNLMSACWGTVSQETATEKELSFNWDGVLNDVGAWFSQISLPLVAGGQAGASMFMATVGTVIQTLAKSTKFGIEAQEVRRHTKTAPPQLDEATMRLKILIQEVEQRTGKPVVVIVDGLDRVSLTETRKLCREGRALADPDLRLILTAPLTLYQAPEFRDLEDFFPYVVVRPNINGAIDRSEEFLRNIIDQRLELCNLDLSRVFEPKALTRLVEGSGGNIRQLIMLVREAVLETERRGLSHIEVSAVDVARHKITVAFADRLQRPALLRAVQGFAQSDRPLPPDGDVGDILLGMKCILAYQDEKRFPLYTLNPLVRSYLREGNLV